MKIVFKLTAAQQLVAIAMAAAQKTEDAAEQAEYEGHEFYFAGSLGGMIVADMSVSSQCLHTEGQFLVYEGTRHALCFGGSKALRKILHVLGSCDEASAVATYYETSDPFQLGLKWYETSCETSVMKRQSMEKLIELVRLQPYLQSWQAAKNEILARLPRGIADLQTKSPYWLAQSYTKEELKALRAVA